MPYGKMAGLLDMLLSFDWYSPKSRHADVLHAYTDALVQAVTGSKNILGRVYVSLTGRFRCKMNAVGEAEMTTSRDTILAVHNCIRRLLNVVPSSSAALLQALESSYPTKFGHHADRLVYLEAALLVTSYCETTTRGVFDLVVQNLLVLDVDIEMEQADIAAADELTFSFDEEAGEEGGIDEDEARIRNYKQQQRAKANHMDMLLEKIFDYIDNQHLHVVQGLGVTSINDFPPDCAKQANFFRTLLHVFDSRVLTSPRAQFVQFIMFYACTKSSHVYAPIFVSHLTGVFKDFGRDQQIRAAAATYIGSFVSRFGRLQVDVTANSLTVLSDWAREYLERLPPGSAPDLSRHQLFYVVANCIFYMVCFRPQCVPSGLGYQMSRIIDGALNPLIFTLPTIREELCSVAQEHSLLDVPTVRSKIAGNKRLLVGLANADFCFSFPFDPYRLSRGDMRLSGFYHHWQEPEEDIPRVRSGESQSEGSDVEDYDDDENDLRAMSLGTPLTGSFAELFQTSAGGSSDQLGFSSVSSSANSPTVM